MAIPSVGIGLLFGLLARVGFPVDPRSFGLNRVRFLENKDVRGLQGTVPRGVGRPLQCVSCFGGSNDKPVLFNACDGSMRINWHFRVRLQRLHCIPRRTPI